MPLFQFDDNDNGDNDDDDDDGPASTYSPEDYLRLLSNKPTVIAKNFTKVCSPHIIQCIEILALNKLLLDSDRTRSYLRIRNTAGCFRVF